MIYDYEPSRATERILSLFHLGSMPDSVKWVFAKWIDKILEEEFG